MRAEDLDHKELLELDRTAQGVMDVVQQSQARCVTTQLGRRRPDDPFDAAKGLQQVARHGEPTAGQHFHDAALC